jgi:hypothetical protein
MQINESRLIKHRRTKSAISELRETIFEAVQQDKPMTVRQVFYRLVTMGAISKTEAEYKTTVVRLLGDMRRDGQLPYRWIADNTRWVRQANTHDSIQDALEWGAKNYRRSLWSQVPAYVEIWLEKEALAGVLYDVTDEWDVPLYVTRGYPSLSFLHTSGESIRGSEYPTYLYYFGDLDPSGVDIPRVVERGIRGFSKGAEIHFEIVAVTREQVEEWELPTRPTKQTDSRARNFEGESVEVDAIPPEMLRGLCRSVIENHLPKEERARVLEIEAAERDSFKEVARYWQEMIS